MATVCALSSLRSEARLDHGVWVLHLTTWKEVKWDQFAVLPMPDNIIRLLNDRCTIELESLNAGGHTADIAEAKNLADTEDHPVQTRNDPTLPADLERASDSPIKSRCRDVEVEAPVQHFDGEESRDTTRDPTPGRYDSTPGIMKRLDYGQGTNSNGQGTLTNELVEEFESPRRLDVSDFGMEDIYPDADVIQQPELGEPELGEPPPETYDTQQEVPTQRTFRMPRKAQLHNHADGPARGRAYLARDIEGQQSEFCFNISAKRSLQEYGDKAKTANDFNRC